MVEYNDLGKFPHTPLPEIWAQAYNYYMHIATSTFQHTAGVKPLAYTAGCETVWAIDVFLF